MDRRQGQSNTPRRADQPSTPPYLSDEQLRAAAYLGAAAEALTHGELPLLAVERPAMPVMQTLWALLRRAGLSREEAESFIGFMPWWATGDEAPARMLERARLWLTSRQPIFVPDVVVWTEGHDGAPVPCRLDVASERVGLTVPNLKLLAARSMGAIGFQTYGRTVRLSPLGANAESFGLDGDDHVWLPIGEDGGWHLTTGLGSECPLCGRPASECDGWADENLCTAEVTA